MPVNAFTPNHHPPVRPDWLDRVREPALEPDLAIVDAHHHFWHRDGYRYFLDELLEDTGSGHRIVRTVFIECGAMYRAAGPESERPLGEVEFANGLAAMSASGLYPGPRAAAGIVGFADLSQGEAIRPVLESALRLGGGRLRGVRNISAWHEDPAARGSSANPPPDLITRDAFARGLRTLASLDLSFDAFMYHTQVHELVALAREVPEARIVMDHVGGAIGIGPYAGARDAVFAEWRTAMAALAQCPNVSVKLGGLGMRLFGFGFHEQASPPTSEVLAERWRPYIETCIELFGVERAMFESNFPVDKGSTSYAVLWNAFKRITAGASEAEKQALFHDTATAFYRLG